MATNGIKVNMAPSPPGDFIRTEVIEELGFEHDEGVPDSGGSPEQQGSIRHRCIYSTGTKRRK